MQRGELHSCAEKQLGASAPQWMIWRLSGTRTIGINRIAINLLKNDKATKHGVKGKRLKAGWDEKYLLNILKI